MSGFFVKGEKKERPGIYKRITNSGGTVTAEAQDGLCIAVAKGTWGPLNVATTVNSGEDYTGLIGASGSGYDLATEMFLGGASKVVICRVGTGGKQASVALKDTTVESAVDVLTLTAKYVGTRALSVTVKESLTEENVKDIVIFDGTKKLETFSISSGSGEVDSAVTVLATSKYVTAIKKAEGNGTLAVVSQAKLAGGEDPEVTTTSYSKGLDTVESEIGGMTSVIALDTDDTAAHALLAAFVRRTYESGCYPIGCVSEPHTVNIDTRMDHAKTFDSEQMVYVLNGWYDAAGVAHEGYMAAARIAGMLAACASNDSLTHKNIQNATSLVENMTNSQIIKAIKSGCLVISTSFVKQIRVEKAINTLVTLTADKDAGWKKLRRLKTRYEVMYRIDESVDALVGNINNDDNGRAAIIAAGQGVLDAMVGEQKLIAGCEMVLDPNNSSEGDSAWFLINADDIDSFEIGYLAYGFRFTSEA